MAQTSAHVVGRCHHKVCSSLWRRHVASTSFCSDPRRHSPKFFRKITYVNTLSELASFVPLTQIDIPPAVYQ